MRRGFTIIETLIVVALFAALVALATPFYYSFQVDYQLGTNAETLLQNLRRAQNQAMTGKGDLKFGVHLASEQYTLFAGSTYAGRDIDYDEVYNLPETVSLSWNLGGGSDIIFEKIKGTAGVAGTITLTSANNESNTISINEAGKIEIQ